MAKRPSGEPGKLIPEIVSALSSAPAHLSPETRRAIAARSGASAGVAPVAPESIPAELYGLIDKIADRATEVTDEDFTTLSARGYTRDQLFDLVLSASLGASHARMRRGLDALDLALARTRKED